MRVAQSPDGERNHRVAYFNGRIVPEREVVLPFRDRGFKYGDAAFDMTRTFHGRPFKLKEQSSASTARCAICGSIPASSQAEMVAASEEVLDAQPPFPDPGHRLLARPAGVARRRCGRRRGLGPYRPQRHRRMHPAAAEGAGAAVPRRHRHRRAADPPRRARHAEPARQDAQLPEPDHGRPRSQGAGQGGLVGAARRARPSRRGHRQQHLRRARRRGADPARALGAARGQPRRP